MKKIVCFGANSDIAKSLMRKLAEFEPSEFLLAGRDSNALEALKTDLISLGAKKVDVKIFDAEHIINTSIFTNSSIEECFSDIRHLDYLIIAHGYLPPTPLYDNFEAHKTFCVNCLSFISIINKGVEIMKNQGFGKIVAITSVAADRGRKKLGIYASAKAAVDSYLSAVRQDCSQHKNIQILTVKPGFVRTKMTSSLDGPLPSTPERVAEDILKAMIRNRDVVYTPWFWRIIMGAIKAIPESLFKRMNF